MRSNSPTRRPAPSAEPECQVLPFESHRPNAFDVNPDWRAEPPVSGFRHIASIDTTLGCDNPRQHNIVCLLVVSPKRRSRTRGRYQRQSARLMRVTLRRRSAAIWQERWMRVAATAVGALVVVGHTGCIRSASRWA